MSVLHIAVDGLPPGTPVATEILNVDTGEPHGMVTVSGQLYVTDLPSGTYIVRLAPPGLSRANTVVIIPDEQAQPIKVAFALGSPGTGTDDVSTFEVDRRARSVLKRGWLGRRQRVRRDRQQPTQTLRQPQGDPDTTLTVYDTVGTLLGPVQVKGECVVSHPSDDAGPVHLCVAEGVGLPRFVTLPGHTIGRVRPASAPGSGAEVTVRPTDPDACALMDYQAQGRLDAALAVTDHVAGAVAARLAAGQGDAVAGCAVAYHLMSHPNRDRAAQWVRTLAARFPSSVDVSLLTAWHAWDDADGLGPDEIRDRLVAAADMDGGLPVFLQGLALLRTALRRLCRGDAAAGVRDPRLESALVIIDRFLSAADERSPFLDFTGSDPLTPRSPVADAVGASVKGGFAVRSGTGQEGPAVLPGRGRTRRREPLLPAGWFSLPVLREVEGLLAATDDRVALDTWSPDGRIRFVLRRAATDTERFEVEVILRDFDALPAVITLRYGRKGEERELLVPMVRRAIGPSSALVGLPGFDGPGIPWEAAPPVPVDGMSTWDPSALSVSVASAANTATRAAWREVGGLLVDDLRRVIEEYG
ncbi:hypothetical protein [Streptomyces sp. N50]|uniref:hypothetical protein n=1 Tax=Streptomyces sp. N50 TaxID=3081765 RepID=UPI002961EB93|nr:hypothetical protein [Streptomyces sp. N50]WOX12554.1 hypothetical protein R2B38_28630 [Streptomyces sp. N50]